MRYIAHILILLCCVIKIAYSQQTPERNYIISQNFKQAGANSNDLSKVTTQIQYLDGLGRPLQGVSVGQSPNGSDIVEPIAF